MRDFGFPGNPTSGAAESSLQNAIWVDQPLRHRQFQSSQDPSLLPLRTSDAPQDQLLALGRFHQDVADFDFRERAKDDLGRHPPGLGRRSRPTVIRFADLGHQACSSGQMVKRFPEGVRQDAHHHMGSRPPAVMVPDGPQEQLTLEYSKGSLDHGQLDVCFPEFARRPAGLVAS